MAAGTLASVRHYQNFSEFQSGKKLQKKKYFISGPLLMCEKQRQKEQIDMMVAKKQLFFLLLVRQKQLQSFSFER